MCALGKETSKVHGRRSRLGRCASAGRTGMTGGPGVLAGRGGRASARRRANRRRQVGQPCQWRSEHGLRERLAGLGPAQDGPAGWSSREKEKGSCAGPTGLDGMVWVFSFSFFFFLFQTTLKLFEFKPYALNQIKLMHQHECTNMFNLNNFLITYETKLN